MARPLVSLFKSGDAASAAVRDLRAAGFPDRAIGMVTPDDTGGGAQRALHDGPPPDLQSTSTASAAAGGVLGGTLGAILAATGALVIPGVGPFITGGVLVSLVGGAAGWLVGGLVGMDVPREEAAYYEAQVQSGMTLVTLLPEGREILATDILRRNGGEMRTEHESGWSKAASHPNRAESSGQNRDLRTTASDDGTVPPTAIRESITAPQQSGQGYLKASPGLGDPPHVIEPLEKQAMDKSKDTGNRVRLAASGFEAGKAAARVGTEDDIPLSPTDPHRESSQGQPYLDDVNPYGRQLPNQQGRPMGGKGAVEHPADPADDSRGRDTDAESPEAFPASIERGDRR